MGGGIPHPLIGEEAWHPLNKLRCYPLLRQTVILPPPLAGQPCASVVLKMFLAFLRNVARHRNASLLPLWCNVIGPGELQKNFFGPTIFGVTS